MLTYFKACEIPPQAEMGDSKLKGKNTDRGMTSSPVRRRELEKDALGGVAHITPTDCTNPCYSRSLSQNIPQSKSPGHLPLGRLRTRACSQDSWGPIPLFQQWLHRCQGCWKWELHPPPWSPAFRHHPWLGDDVWRGVRTSYWNISGRKHWEEKPLPLPVCSLSASHLCLESWALGFLLLPYPLLSALLPRPDGLLVLWTCQPKCALSFTNYLGLSNFMTETENELIQKQKTNELYLSTWYGSWLCEYISVSHTCS